MFSKINHKGKVVAIAGCGGGYDIFGGIPLYFDAINEAKKIILINFSFTDSQSFEISVKSGLARMYTRYLFCINRYENHDGISEDFFPEARLASYLNHSVYAILIHENPKLSDITESYNHIIQNEGSIDVFYLVDGGCDVLLTGTEQGLGTPVEDMMHLKVINNLNIREKYVMAIGVDVDVAHGVKLDDLIKRLEQLDKYKVDEKLLKLNNQNVIKYTDAVKSCQPTNSIVQSLIIASLEGHTGHYTPNHLKRRIKKNRINLNSRVCTAYIYPLSKIASDVKYLDKIEESMNTDQVDDLIGEFHYNIIHNRSANL
jgi:hypothetical protein